MKIYLGIKFHSDNRNQNWIAELSKHLESQGHSVFCVVRDLEQWGKLKLEATDLMKKTFKLIDECDLVLIDLTEKGVGLGIEAGYAHAGQKPVVTIAKVGSEVSNTIAGISSKIITYTSVNDISL